MTESSHYYLIHVSEDCPWCTRSKALLEHYQVEYRTTSEPCPEWPTVPAIYRVTAQGKELLGGYDQLCQVSLDGEL